MNSLFNTRTLALMPIAIVLNLVLGQLVKLQGVVPIYLDTVGTVIVGVLSGPLAGAVVGILSNVLNGFISGDLRTWVAFAPVAAVIGIIAGLVGARSWIRNLPPALLAGVITAIIAGVLSTPILIYLFGGLTGAPTDRVYLALLNVTGNNEPLSAFLASLITDVLDKVITYFLVFFSLTRLPRRLLVQFPQGERTAPPRREPLIGRVKA